MSPKSRLSDATFRMTWKKETTEICRIQTYRNPDIPNAEVNGRILEVRQVFERLVAEFNPQVTTTKFSLFQWCANIKEGTTGENPEDLITTTTPSDEDCKNSDYWIFGFRFGATDPVDRVCIICHVDTVPANEGDDWCPFEPHVVETEYSYPNSESTKQDFLVGRGCIDDKGPAVSAFMAARTLAKTFDGHPRMQNTMVEIIFDTSEETDMSTPRWLEDPMTKKPNFGVVYDAQWCVRAEKGCERPVFSVDPTSEAPGGVWIESIVTAPGNSTNTIPDWCKAVIRAESPEQLTSYAITVDEAYRNFAFDDEDYRRAPFKSQVVEVDGEVKFLTLETTIVGAQHGSAPEENRLNGANPLVSLANFLAGEVEKGRLMQTSYASIAKFINWMWGTKVFGESHERLYEYDSVFTEGNGTTYAVTKVSEGKTGRPKVEVDIRYAVPHHECGWDGKTEGMLDGKMSTFKGIFDELVCEYNANFPMYSPIHCETRTIFGPDIRTPDTNDNFKICEKAYYDVKGTMPPRLAIGGGTDAKGYVFLLGVGPLFSTNLGPPINYHGIGEGAPMDDLRLSTEILVNLMTEQILHPPPRSTESSKLESIKRVKGLREEGHKFCCNC